MGLTDMEDAFKAGLAASWSDDAVNSAVFLTDGKPTWPVSSTTQSVMDTVKKLNAAGKIGIYTFGVGDDVDEGFLLALAKANAGSYTAITAADSITPIMTSFMRMISYPLIKNCGLSYGGLETYDVLPNPLPNLVATSQLTVLGRYKGTGVKTVTFTGMAGKNPMTLSRSLPFPAVTPSQKFVPRMWASAKINSLLEQIALYGQRKELVDAVTALGLKYSIVTPYTSLIALPVAVKPGQLIEDKTGARPQALSLVQYRNGTMTMLRYAVPATAAPQKVCLKIYDARGRLVRTLVNDVTLGGNFLVAWDCRDDAGRKLGAGLFLAVLEAGTGRCMIALRVI